MPVAGLGSPVHLPQPAPPHGRAPLACRLAAVAPGTWLVEPAPRPAPVRVKPEPVAHVRIVPPVLPDSEPQEIVVTGSKRDIPISAYPGGVQIVDGDSLSAADAGRGNDILEARVASVASTHLGPGRNKLFIRGIADSSFVGPTQATVGQYWGNSRITYSAPDPSLRLYDVQRIEVLEGPQGTLYGAGSLGGVVRVVPHAPDLETAGGSAWGGVQAIQHGQPGVDGGAILNVPIVDGKLGFRALGFGAIDGGYIDDVERGLRDVNQVRTYGGRAALRYEPGDDWTFDLSGVGQWIKGDDSQYAERDSGGDGLSRASSIAQPYRNDYWLIDLVARKQWGTLDLTSSLGYARQYVFEQFEGAPLADPLDPTVAPVAVAIPSAAYVQTDRISMVTAETRLSRRGPDGTGWLVGLSLLHNEARVNRWMQTEMFGVPLTGISNKVDEATLYGEGTVEPIARVTLTAGGRLTHSRLSGYSQDALLTVAYRVDPDASAERSETRLLPSAAIAWRANDALTLFARYQQGFRPGGIAVRREFVQRFKGDRVGTTDIGARYDDGRFSLSLSASWTEWKNIQADLIDGFGFPTTANIGDGRVLAVGAAARWRPLPGLSFDAALYLNDSKVTSYSEATLTLITLPANNLVTVGGVPPVADGQPAKSFAPNYDRLPNVADTTGRLGFAYTTSLGSRLDLDVNGFARYVGKSTLGIGQILGQLQGDYLDTGLELRVGTPRRGISLSATNLLDSRGNRFALGSPFLIRDRNQITPLQPRSIRLGFDLAF
ncbi:TonB-dependent receptor [Sphingomonas sp. dw_22]|uniref:TonB-dependent receptor n=1 Tax=Sphingomonas sp. dw_22 TaxID=2721175 RepID=UPI001BD696F8